MHKTTTNTKPHWLLGIVLCLIALLCFLLWYFRVHYLYDALDYQRLDSNGGVWDLIGYDFENSFARLNGEVEYIPDALLTPEEFDERSGEAQIGTIDDNPVNTARLRILVPDDGIYMLAMGSVDFSERIYINGQWRQDAGAPALTAENSIPGYAYMYFEVQPQNGVIEIVRQSANFVHRENGGAAGVRIGSPQIIKRHLTLETDLTALTMGLFLALFLAHGLLYVVLRRYRANLYFALLCLTWFLRTGVTGVKVLTSWLPGLPWEVMFRLEYLAAPVAGILILFIMREVFPTLFPKRFVPTFGGLFGAYALCCIFLPTLPLSYSMMGFEILFMLVGLAILALLIAKLPRMARAGGTQPEHWIVPVGYLFFLFAAVHDALYYNGVYLFGKGFILSDLALLVFALFQMVAMFYATMRQMAQARQAELLAWESAELARKNEELARLEAENLRKDMELRERILSGIPEENLVTCGELILNTLSSQAYLSERDLLLTPKEFALLLYFIRHEGEVVERGDLYENIWKQPMLDSDRTLATHIHHLRKKVEGSAYVIESRRGKGYFFEKR